jgi:signal peptidase I
MWFITKWPVLIKIILTLLILAPIPFYLFVAQPFKVSGKAMYPGLNDQEYILVKKFTVDNSPLKRGEIITFANPRNSSQSFIKRVVGLPGERLKLLNNEVYINGKRLDETYLDTASKLHQDHF